MTYLLSRNHSLIVLFSLALSLCISAKGANRKALLIGNGSYAGAPLSDPLNDVDLIDASLRQVGFETYKYKDLHMSALNSAFEVFNTQVKQGDEIVVFYGGHGLQVSGENYILPVDYSATKVSELRDHTLSVEWLLENLERKGAKFSIVFLDSCRTDGDLLQRDLPAVPPRSTSGVQPKVRGIPNNVLIFYSTKHGQPAYDGPGAHSLFAQNLAEEMMIRDQELMDLVHKVTNKVSTESKRYAAPQQPYIYGSVGTKFIFHPSGQEFGDVQDDEERSQINEQDKMVVTYTGKEGINIRDSRDSGSNGNVHGALYQQTTFPLRKLDEVTESDGRTWVKLEVTGWIPVKNINNTFLTRTGDRKWKVVWNRPGDNFVAMRTGTESKLPLVCKVAYATELTEIENDFADEHYKYILAKFSGWAVKQTSSATFFRRLH